MPTLDWIGRDKVINHHLEVPFRVLDKRYDFGAESENMIIRGDNLDALKALLPKYEGRVKCVYIDPPYNTGNEGWVYSDSVSDPHIRRWLGAVVGKEGEDLTRHDKWLCMMYPRLRLLQKLLAEDGAIFISIDDNELYNLKLICDEIFGAGCFVANIAWQRTYSTRNDAKGIVSEIEHIIVYSKNPGWQPKKLPRTEDMNSRYRNPDNDISLWKSGDASAPGAATHQGMVYAIQHPFTGEMIYPANNRCWTYQQDQMLEIMRGWCEYELKDLNDDHERALVCGVSDDEVRKDVKAIVLSESLDISREKAQKVYDRGQWPKLYFTSGGRGGIARKIYIEDVGGVPPTNLFEYKDTGHTDEASKELKTIFGGRSPFDTPKPARLIERILQIASEPDSIVLDSFAGSGTTAHAVLNMNRADGGNRKFILVEMMDYAETITAERVRRVIGGYGDAEGTGGGFSFYDLGEPIMIDGVLNEAVGTEKLREYVWYSETRSAYEPPAEGGNGYLLGSFAGTRYYFCYEPEGTTVLDADLMSQIGAGAAVIYADRCALSEAELLRLGVTFRKIPRDVRRN